MTQMLWNPSQQGLQDLAPAASEFKVAECSIVARRPSLNFVSVATVLQRLRQ